jgi:HPt (histidine-containing phosphotransfer) domain-containing protein
MALDIPGINVNSGLDLYEGDVNIFLRFVRMYVSRMPAALDKMRNVSEETLHDYTVSVHGVKGISETVGAEEIVNTARQLEAMGKAGDLAGILAQNSAFIKRAEIIVDGIRNWLDINDKQK